MAAKLSKKTDLVAARKAASDLHRAVREAARARRKLAKVTRPGAPAVIVEPPLAYADAILKAREKTLSSIEGVVGFGLGHVIKGGKPTGEPCITVFVDRKLERRNLGEAQRKSVPRSLSYRGRRVRVDVVELGNIELKAFVGASLGPTDVQSEGTIGAFACDNQTKKMVAITAMHVSGISVFPNGGPAVEFSVPSLMQTPSVRRLGVMTFGTRVGADAAKIELDNAADADQEIPWIGAVNGWRPVTIPGDENLAVRMFGAESGLIRGAIVYPSVRISEASLFDAIIADIPAVNGDSGAALVDAENHVLGFLVGGATSGPNAGFQIFCSAAAVVNLLDCDF
jgi:hypothetical protein